MEKKIISKNNFSALRKRAEKIIDADSENIFEDQSPEETKNLIHELNVHQIELEMQNEELRNSQLELKKSRDGYSDLYELAPVGYFTLNDKGFILKSNLTGATMLGVDRAFLSKKRFSQFISKDAQDDCYLMFNRLIKEQMSQTIELKFEKKDSTLLYAQMESKLVKDDDGNYNVILLSITDITERKLAEEALKKAHDELEIRVNERTVELTKTNEALRLEITERKQAEKELQASEERYRDIINKSPMGIHIYKLEDDGSLILKGSNAAADVLTGTNNSELIGKTIEKAFPSLLDTEVPDTYRKIASEGITWNIEEIYYKDQFINGVFEVQAYQSGPGIVTVIFSNITDRKLVEEGLQAHEKLQGVLETAGAVCHELNQPLQAISGFSELISMGIDDDNPLWQRLNKIKEQVDRVAVLTRKFAAITRYKSKPHDKKTKILDIDDTQDRRRYVRHIPRSGAVVSIESDPLKQIPIIDISQGGLAFYYNDRENQLSKSGVLTLRIPDENLTLEEIPYNIVAGYSKPDPISLNNNHKTRVGVQFEDLKTQQSKQLEGFFSVN